MVERFVHIEEVGGPNPPAATKLSLVTQMKIVVKAKAKSKKKFVKKLDSTHFEVAVNDPSHEGKANKAIIKSLSEFFDIPQSKIILISGEKSREKVFEVEK